MNQVDNLKKYLNKKIQAIVTGEKVTFNINVYDLLDELEDLETKAHKLDLIHELYDNRWDMFSNDFEEEINFILNSIPLQNKEDK